MPLPTPIVPADALPGFALSQAISSFMSFAGRVFFPMIQSGAIESIVTGSRSFSRSN